MKHFQAAAIAAGSVLVASALLTGVLLRAALLIPVGTFVLFYGVIRRAIAPALLPSRAVQVTHLINLEWIGWVGLGSLIGGLPLWLAARLPDDASAANEAGLTVVAVVAGLALIEVLKKLTVDDDFIEAALQSGWKRTFENAFSPLLADGTISPDREIAEGQFTKSFAWQALYLPPLHGGYGRQGRLLRAQDLRAAYDSAFASPSPPAGAGSSVDGIVP